MLLRQMQFFVSIVDENSFTEAAEKNYVSQSAVSQALNALESDLGVKLIERKNRSFQVTTAGEYFYRKCKSLLSELDAIKSETIRLESDEEMALHIGYINLYAGPELSDAFCKPTDAPELEVVCRVLNVNPDCQGELKKKSRTLYGYSLFVEKVRKNQADGEDLDTAVVHAMKVCIEEHVLEDFFRTRGDEVRKVMQFDMRWERREQLIREEERQQGESRGHIMEYIDIRREDQYTEEDIRQGIMKKFNLTEGQADCYMRGEIPEEA